MQIVVKLLKANVIHKQYKRIQLIKQSKIKISKWIENVLERRKTRIKIK